MNSTPASVIGYDIGGAYLKAARVENGVVVAVAQTPCAPHLGLEQIEQAIRAVDRDLGPAERRAVTMTAELSDAFADRLRGVVSIAAICAREWPRADIRFYAGAEGFIERAQVAERARAIASANWRASAELAARALPDALFIDMGSTTTDIVPIRESRLIATGEDDASRLACGELVYTGLLRGDPTAGVGLLPQDGRWAPPIGEIFATFADVHRALGQIAEGDDQAPTVDGRDKSPDTSRARLARLTGRDVGDAPSAAWDALAHFLARAQLRRIEDQIALIASREPFALTAPIVGAGIGRAVIANLARREGRAYHDFAEFLPTRAEVARAAANCAPACAVALLASEAGVWRSAT